MLPLVFTAILAAIGIGALMFVLLRGRNSSEADASGSGNVTHDQTSVPSGLIDEMRALTERIEKIFEAQKIQGETQRQKLAQEIDTVRDHIEQQQHLITGLRNELRHEIRRRDDELKALREQLASGETSRGTLQPQKDSELGGDSLATAMDSIVLSTHSSNGQPADREEPSAEATDRLTNIDGIDETIQERLYALGVRSLNEIAHWGREDARRIAGKIDVPEETIRKEWIFAAQAALFEKHQALFSEEEE